MFSVYPGFEDLSRQWNDEESDAYFAWQWARWDERTRYQQLSGILPYFAELERVMKLILVASNALWNEGTVWHWWFYPGSELLNLRPDVDDDQSASELRSGSISYGGGETPLQQWTPFLLRGYSPQWRSGWFKQHCCTRLAWETKGQLHAAAKVLATPTAHQQLEARLSLREWLTDKATPDVAASLLASLDD